jgi:hypothetical protein
VISNGQGAFVMQYVGSKVFPQAAIIPSVGEILADLQEVHNSNDQAFSG